MTVSALEAATFLFWGNPKDIPAGDCLPEPQPRQRGLAERQPDDRQWVKGGAYLGFYMGELISRTELPKEKCSEWDVP